MMSLKCVAVYLLLSVAMGSVVKPKSLHSEEKLPVHKPKENWPPKFCKGLSCPKFTVLESNKEYEYRRYEVSYWVATDFAHMDYDQATSPMFGKLFDYISGDNQNNEKIDMTCPVLTRIIPGPGPACESNFTMSFFIAPNVAPGPQPSDRTVYLSTMATMDVYVRSFGGFASGSDYLEEAMKLAEALPESASYYSDFYYTAGYDSPYAILNRHNEVWFVAK